MRLLILSTTTGYQLRAFGDAAAELGVELMFATDRCHALDDPWRDAAVPVRFHDEEGSLAAILDASRTRPIDGVLALGDRPVVLAALAAGALGLRGNPPGAARASAHKRLARERFAADGLTTPWHLPVRAGADLGEVLDRVRYPAVIKPVALSGSRGVIRADNPNELVAAYERVSKLVSRPEVRAQRTGSEGELLIEGFVAGREYAVEGLLTGGELRPLALFDKPDPLDGPFFEETIYVTPAAVTEEVARAIHATVARAARALGLRHGPIHAECRLAGDTVVVLEVAARPIGGLCSRVLRFTPPPPSASSTRGSRQSQAAGTGGGALSLEHVLLRHALGEDVSGIERDDRAAAVMMIPIPRRGVLRGVAGEAAARDVPRIEDVRITAKQDQLLEPLPEAGSYLGFIFARAASGAEAEAAVREAHRRLTFRIDPAIPVRTGP